MKKFYTILVSLFIFISIFLTRNCGAQWVQVWNGMGQTESVRSLYYNGTKLFAGLYLQGIYVSTNEGLTWSQTSVQYWNSVNVIKLMNSNIFAGTDFASGGRIFRSSDNGTTWNNITEFSYSPYSFISSGSNLLCGLYINGVYSSTNNGNNWTQTYLNNKTVFTLEQKDNYIIAGTAGSGIYYSTDNGNIWTQSSFNNKTIRSLCVLGQTVFAGTESNGIYSSSDNGIIWTQLGLNSLTILNIINNGSVLFAGTSSNGVYMSSNNGLNWSAINDGFPSNTSVYSLTFTNNYIIAGTDGTSVYRRPNTFSPPSAPTLISPVNNATGVSLTPTLDLSDVSGANTYGVQVSTNSNFTSTVVNVTGLTSSQYTVPSGILASNTQYYWRANATNGNGTSGWSSAWNYTTYTNLTGWVRMNGIINSGHVTSIIAKDSIIFAGLLDSGVYISTNGGTLFTQTALSNKVIYTLATDNYYIFAAGPLPIGSGCFYRSSDNGISWWITSQITPIWTYSLATFNSNIFAGDIAGIFNSTNYGTNWIYSNMNRITHSFLVNGSILYAGTENYGIYFTSNNGQNWTKTLFPDNFNVSSLKSNGIYFFAGIDDISSSSINHGVYRSINGNNWTITSLNNHNVYSLEIDGSNIIAGTENGVYFSTNNGQNWILKNEGFIGIPKVKSLLIANNYVYAGTDGQAVWRRPFYELFIGIKNISEKTPNKFSLTQNYPNPFNPTTKIQFDIAKLCDVKIVVYDVMGREIQTLVNESLKPGTYETTFDGSMLNSGVYFYKITSGEFTETKRMLLIK